MKFRFLLSTLALLLCVSLSAQTTERAKQRAKNRAENRANQKVDNEVDKAVDEAFNAIGSLFKKKNKKKKDAKTTETSPSSEEINAEDDGAAAAINNMFGRNAGPWEAYTNPVTFSLVMEMTEIKKNGKEQQFSMELAVDETNVAFRMKDTEAKEQTRMILNTQDGKTTMISTDKKGEQTAVRMRMPGTRYVAQEAIQETMDNFTVEKTGERKTIDGYSCEKYVVTDTKEGWITESWVTTDLEINAQDIYGSILNGFSGGQGMKSTQNPAGNLAGLAEGFPILSTQTQNGKTYVSRYRNIRVGESAYDRSLMNTDGIQIQSVGF
ncbi:MAG: DUF4412 domain-containing protein [Bacteroidota bacterium]